MGVNWAHAWPTVTASFLASLVEFVEALTVVLAVGVVRGWRPALTGAAAAALVLVLGVLLLGPLLSAIPLAGVQLVIGVLLLLFGLRWLGKAILRAAGVIPLHDETAAYEREKETLHGHARGAAGWDAAAMATAFKITLLEGLEVVFIVIAVGAGGGDLLVPASLGALAALVAVILLGLALHRPLAMIPENAMKFVVGVLLTAFGAFWVGEGIGLRWPGGDWSIPGLSLVFLCAALAGVLLCSRRAPQHPSALREARP